MYVSWGKSARYKFECAGELRGCTPHGVPAVFAITYKQNPTNKPKAHTVLYFGHAADLSRELPAINEEMHELWHDRGGNNDELYVFICPMPGSTSGQRSSVQWQLVSEYSPTGNY